MRTVLLSDVHLGSPDSRASDLLRVLEGLEFSRLILVGDIFSDLNFSRLSRSHFALLAYIRSLSSPKRGIEVVWIEGNHDHGLIEVMSHIVGVPAYEHYEWVWGGKKCLAMHGHQFDAAIRRNQRLSRWISWCFLEAQRVPWARSHLCPWIEHAWSRMQGLSPAVSDLAITFAETRGIDLIFCGHTHQAHRSERGGVTYFNTGCWVGPDCSYVLLDDTKVEVVLIQSLRR